MGNSNPIILDKNTNGISSFQLPSGPQEDSYKISLFVQIIDDSDGITEHLILTPVIVKQNDQLVNNLANNLLNSNTNDTNMKNNLINGDLLTTSSFITSFVSILDDQKALNNSLNGTNSVRYFYYKNRVGVIHIF